MKINKKLSVMAGRNPVMGSIIGNRTDFRHGLKKLRAHYQRDDNGAIVNYFESRYNREIDWISLCEGGFKAYLAFGFPRTIARAGLSFLLGSYLEYREARKIVAHT